MYFQIRRIRRLFALLQNQEFYMQHIYRFHTLNLQIPAVYYGGVSSHTVSYTHLDVYKRQVQNCFGPVGSVLIPSGNPLMLAHRLFELVGWSLILYLSVILPLWNLLLLNNFLVVSCRVRFDALLDLVCHS